MTITISDTISNFYEDKYKLILGGKNYRNQFVELDIFPLDQLSQENFQEFRELKNSKSEIIRVEQKGFWRVYNQKYSGVIGVKGSLYDELDYGFEVVTPVGYPTQQDELPKMGTATYHGVAFDETEQGKLTYHVDFANKQGHGEITGLSKFGAITLEPGSINNEMKQYIDHYSELRNQLGIISTATNASDAQVKVRKYKLHFFGPEAKEVTGVVFGSDKFDNDDSEIGFGGSR